MNRVPLITVFLVAATAAAGGSPLDRPGGVLPGNAVPVGQLGKIARVVLAEVAGLNLVAGKPIPYCSLDGRIVAYDFPFCQPNTPFPSDDRIVAELADARGNATGPQSRDWRGKPSSWGVGRYWTVTVSVTEDRPPVSEVFEGLPRFFTVGDLARERAAAALGTTRPHLTRIYYASPLSQLFEFSSGADAVLVSPFSLETIPRARVKEEPRKPSDEDRKAVARQWQSLKAKAR